MNKNILILIFLILFCLPVSAHKPSDSYLSFNIIDSNIDGQWDISLKDLDYGIGLDSNNDNLITWGEVKQNKSKIVNYVFDRLVVKLKNQACKFNLTNFLIDNHSDGAYCILQFDVENISKSTISDFDIDYNLLFDLDSNHRGIVSVKNKDKVISAILSPTIHFKHFDLYNFNLLGNIISFIKEGIRHIWIGADHILFLLSLLISAVFIFRNGKYEPSERFYPSFWNVFKIVTAFTVAHSVTLSLAALGVINLPSRLVESVIALSVLLAALDNIFCILKDKKWLFAFLFGLVHGFGFANVLAELGLPKNYFLSSLISFNIGVEIGQLGIVLLFLPLAFKLSRLWIYEKLVVSCGSFLIAFVGFLWFVERTFNLSFMPF